MFAVEAFQFQREGLLELNIPSFTILGGEVFCIEGDSDARISEFLQVIVGFEDAKRLTDTAKSGQLVRPVSTSGYSDEFAVKISSESLRDLPRLERAKTIAFVFGDPEFAVLGETVAEEIRYSQAALGNNPGEYPDPLVLAPYGLYEKLERRTRVLSGGELHRLALACAMERSAKILVLDLTRSNLDIDFEEWVLGRLPGWIEHQRINNGGAAIIVAGIPMKRVMSICGTGNVRVRSGYLLADGTLEVDASPPAQSDGNLKLSVRALGEEPFLIASDLGRRGVTLRRQSFSIRRGEVLAFHGPNGAGKTSIAKLIAGRASEADFNGSLKWTRSDVQASLAIQHADRSFLFSSVEDEVKSEGLRELVGLSQNDLTLHPRALPYEKQKLLSIAIAIEASDCLVVMDEPTCGMSKDGRECVVNMINAHPDLAFIVFSHDQVLQGILGSKELGLNIK
ncbi:ATP-binding cassette domain-containing protein [Haloferula sp.]|uniref:ATP-binding cassette domain-containing protein n=1 Tax=Haloferula sp. TaxID=2497595 RepID=UPI003C764680